MKKCGKCGEVKARSEFHKSPSKKDGLQSMCKECRKLYIREHYQKNKDKYKRASRDQAKRNRLFVKRVKQRSECHVCNDKRWYVLDFHHVDGKKDAVSKMAGDGVSIATLKLEIRNCIIVCANCHREIHHNAPVA